MSQAKANPPRTKPNYLYSIVSVALVLFLLGFFGLLLLHARELVRLYKEQVNILVEFQEGIPPAQVDSIQGLLVEKSYLLPESVRYISRQDAAAMMQDEFGDDFQKLGLPNPFYDMLSFNLRASHMHPDSLAWIRSEINALPLVSDVYYQESMIDELVRNLRKVGYIALGVGLFFFIVAVTLIHNTIRLALYANRFLIKNMQLVGASWMFISRPYLLRALGHGFIASVLAIVTLSGLLFWVRSDIPQLGLIDNPMIFVYLLLGLIPLGMLLYGSSTYRVVNKYLKMRVDDLY